VSMKTESIHFSDKPMKIYVVKNLTPIVNYEAVKVENHFYEMLTATVSHEMRTPINVIIGLLNSLEHYI
jgi:signal transduction histidine kinase